MTILYLVLCLTTCETIRPQEWPREASLMQCQIFAQHFASEWQRMHPLYAGHRLKSWRCEVGEEA